MKNQSTLIWIFSTTLAVGALGAWRYFNPPHPIPHVAVVTDRSDSMLHDCTAVAALGQRALTLPYVSPKSTLSLFSTTNLEPDFVATWKMPAARLTTESKRQQMSTGKAFFENLQKHCKTLPEYQTSPILRSIRQVISHLQALNRSPDAGHFLLARTDLQETSDAALKRLLLQPAGSDIRSENIPLIDNFGVNIIVCGYAESLPPRSGQNEYSIERIKEVWPTLFLYPTLVYLEPYCPKLTAEVEQ
jgi:hypothetical protein